jgi:hypothetical protein
MLLEIVVVTRFVNTVSNTIFAFLGGWAAGIEKDC